MLSLGCLAVPHAEYGRAAARLRSRLGKMGSLGLCLFAHLVSIAAKEARARPVFHLIFCSIHFLQTMECVKVLVGFNKGGNRFIKFYLI